MITKKYLLIALIAILFIIGGVVIIKKFTGFDASREGKQAITSYNSNNIDGAITTLEQVISENRNNHEAMLLLAASYAQKGSLEFKEKEYGNKALDIVNEVIKKDPTNSEAYRIKGYAYEIMQDYDNALASYNKSIELDSKNAFAFSNRGHAYDLLGKLDQSRLDYDAALSINPTLDHALLNSARLALREGDFATVKMNLDKLITFSDNSSSKSNAEQILGVVALEEGKFEEAHNHFKEALLIFPKYPAGLVGLAESQFLLLNQNIDSYTKEDFANKINEVVNQLNYAISLYPNQTSAYLTLSEILESFGETEEARRLLTFARDNVVAVDISLGVKEKELMRTHIQEKLNALK